MNNLLLKRPSFFIRLILKLGVVLGLLFLVWITQPPKIAILYIATGNYIVFWDAFYESMEKKFLPEYKKTYFIFTDDTSKKFPKNVVKIYQKQLPWPYPTLNRFNMFLGIEDKLKKYDYLYFLNANAKVLDTIGTEIFPTKEQGIMVALHPVYQFRDVLRYTYERNQKSTAYIDFSEGEIYVQGCFNGGRTDDYLELIRTCAKNIEIDKKNGIIAIWHDESHLNKYILDKNPLIVGPEYIWANYALTYGAKYPEKVKILMRDKDDFGGVKQLRFFGK